MGRRLLAGDEAGAHPGGSGPERAHRGEATAIGDPAGGDDGRVGNGIDDRGHEGEGRHLAPDVAARLPALGDDDIDPGVDGSPRLLGGCRR